jgi:hypothetical protein
VCIRHNCATFALVAVQMECVVVVVTVVVVVRMNASVRDSRSFTFADHSRVKYLS